MVGLLTTVTAYLLGSIPFGYVIVRWQRGIDVRQTGSHSIGATNVMRNLGVTGFVATFVFDCGKGFAAVFLASKLTGSDPRWVAAAAVAAVAGHIFPIWLGFKGGKGVATGVGVFVALAAAPVGLVLMFFAVLVAIWRYISLGSIIATASFPLLVYLVNRPPKPIIVGAACAAALIIGSHHTNIRRLLNGTENKLGKKPSAVSRQQTTEDRDTMGL
jgi:glycerol-3-phosphate acyltransferase PlsY